MNRGRTGFDVVMIVKGACRAFLLSTRKINDKKTNAEFNTAVATFFASLFAMIAGLFAPLRRREDDYSSLSFVL